MVHIGATYMMLYTLYGIYFLNISYSVSDSDPDSWGLLDPDPDLES